MMMWGFTMLHFEVATCRVEGLGPRDLSGCLLLIKGCMG